MGKRVADRQLTQLNQDESDSEGSTGNFEGTFRKANEEVLATRVIKKPKSRLRGGPSANAPTLPTNSFAGFGSPTPAADSSADAAEPPKKKPTFAGFSFGSTVEKKQGEDAPKPAASSSGFSFGSFGQATTAGNPAISPSGFGFGGPARKSEDNKPAASTSGFSFGGFGNSKPAEEAAKPATSSGFGFGSTAAKTETSKPAASSSGFSFGALEKPMPAEKAAETPAKPTTGFSMPAFKPPTAADASNSGLKSSIFASQATKPTFSSFVPPAGSAPAAPAPKNDEVESMDEDRDEEYYKNIRGLNVSIQKKINDAVSVNAFVNLAPLLEQYKKHWDAINKPAAGVPESDTKMVSPVKPTAPATFGAKPEEAKPEEAKPEEAKKSEEKPVPAFGIAAASKESADSSQPKFGFKAAVTSPAKPSSGFSFSFTKPSPASAAPADDKPKFSFGFSKPGESAPAAQDKPKFSFGGIGPSAASKPDESQNADDDAANDDEENVDEPPKKPTTAGEEGEITETETRSKLYKWDAEAKAYKDLGIGIFKVKSWTADGAKRARLLCRQVGSDKLTLNVSVFREMVTDHQDGKKEVVVMVIVDGKPVRYLVRVKTPEMAKALYDVIERVKGEL